MRTPTLALLLFASATAAAAAPITPTVAYLDPVTGFQWANVTQFADVSFDALEAVCPASHAETCVDVVGGVDLTGWHFADRDAVLKMFTHLTDLTHDDFLTNEPDAGRGAIDRSGASTWAPLILDTFGILFSGAFQPDTCGGFSADILEGWTNRRTKYPGFAGAVGVRDSAPALPGCETLSTADLAGAGGHFTGDDGPGAWLYRRPVPEPGTFALAVIGAAAAARRRRNSLVPGPHQSRRQ